MKLNLKLELEIKDGTPWQAQDELIDVLCEAIMAFAEMLDPITTVYGLDRTP